jgi:gluconate 2-dehydrogenase gamma chain
MSESRSRRNFLKVSGLAVGGGWLTANMGLVLAAGEQAAEAMAKALPWQVLGDLEARELAAIADQILPPGETPGAAELGAVRFMDAAFGGFMAGSLPMIREALAGLAGEARKVDANASGFYELSFEQQTELLRQIENTGFFGTVHFLTLCGVFSSPSYGGNKDQGGWDLLGFEPRHVWHPPFGYYDAEYAKEANDASA